MTSEGTKIVPTFSKSLIGLSALLHRAVVIVCSRGYYHNRLLRWAGHDRQEKQAHSSHRCTKKSTCAAFALANLLQKANSGSSWRLSSEQFGGTECSFVYHVPGPLGISPGYFCPSRASSQCFSQTSGASRSQHRLSSFLLM